MAKNEFLPFGTAEGANVLSNQEYERLAARFNGFTSGVAKSKELNTVWRQSSVMSSALAQFIVDSDNKDLLDNGDIAGIKNRLVAAIKQTISGVGYVTTAAMNLELNKKFDKANISGVLGNDNNKVPSLNLFTTEISKLQPTGYSYSKIESDGKYQPKGNYAPAGDYVTIENFSNELKKKRDVNDLSFKGTVNLLNPSKDDFLNFGGDGTGYALQVAIVNNNTNGRFYFHDRAGKKTIYLPIHEKSGTIALTTDIPNVVNATGSSATDVMNQNSVTNELNKKFDKTGGVISATSKAIDIATRASSSGYIQISDENAKAIHHIGKLSADSTLSIRNVSENGSVTIKGDGVRFNGSQLALKSEIPSFVTKFQDVTTSRSNNVNYVNTNSHPIFIVLQSKASINQNAAYTVNGVVVRWAVAGGAEGFLTSATIPVPPGATYSANGFEKWIEVS